MKSVKNPFIASLLFGASFGISTAGVIYSNSGPITVNNNGNGSNLPGLNLSRSNADTGTLYFKFTIVNPASNMFTENYYAGFSFYSGSSGGFIVGNEWGPWAYSGFNYATGPGDLNSATPEAGAPYQLVRPSDITTIVMRVDFVSGGNDNITVWMNPDLNSSEGAQAPSLVTHFTANVTFDSIRLLEGAGGDGWTFSDIAIAENSSDAGFFDDSSRNGTWTNLGGGSWNTGSNWNAAAIASGPDRTARFDTLSMTSNTTVTLASAVTIGNMIFGDQGGTYNWTIGSGTITLDSSTIPAITVNNGSATIGAELGGTSGLAKNGAGTLTLAADQSYSGDTEVTAGTLVLDYSTANGSKLPDGGWLALSGGALSLAGGSHPEIVSNTEVSANSVITRTSGTSTINLGFITRTGSNRLNILGGSIARTSLGNDVSGRLPSWITVNGLPAANDGSGNIVAYSAFTNVFRLGGTIPNNPANNVRIVNGGITGPIIPTTSGLTDISMLLQTANAGSAVVSLDGSDTLRLGADGAIQVPSTSGSLTIEGGFLTAGGGTDADGEIAVNAESDLTITSGIVNNGLGVVSLSKIGAGALTLGEINDFSGGIILNAGQLRIANALSLGLGSLTINGGSIDNTSGAPMAVGDTIPQAWNADFSFAGSNDLEFSSGNVTLSGNRTVTVSNTLLGIGGAVSGPFSFTKAGAGSLRIASCNWTGATTVNAGTLEVQARSVDTPYVVGSAATLKIGYSNGDGYANSNLKITGNGIAAETGLQLMGGASYNASGVIELLAAPTTIRQYGSGLASIGTFDINGDALITVPASSGSVIDSNIQMVSRGFGMSVNVAVGAATATGDLVINGPLNAGVLGFYKRGAGSLALNGVANPANAALQIQGGSVITGVANAIGETANLLISGGAKLVLNGFSQAAGSLSGSGSVVNASGTAAVLAITQATDQTFSGVLGGATADDNNFSLVKAGDSKLTLTGANSYSGNTAVNAGTLSIATPYLADASDVLITTGAILDLTTATTDTIDELILDGTPQPAGVYGALVSGAQFERSYITGNGTLTVTTGSAGFTSWADSWTGPTLSDKTADGDPDGDSIVNLLEYILGGDPRSSSSSILPTQSVVGSNLVLSYKRNDTSETDTTQIGQWSTDLVTWNGPITPVLVNENGSAPDDVTISVPLSNAVGGSLFVRLKATR